MSGNFRGIPISFGGVTGSVRAVQRISKDFMDIVGLIGVQIGILASVWSVSGCFCRLQMCYRDQREFLGVSIGVAEIVHRVSGAFRKILGSKGVQ